jgi:ATP/maltotriose-dependent transcriptional regulator MalT
MERRLVGRAKERETIARALAAVHERESRVVVLEGEPGIGKSALLADLAATAENCTVLGARASEFEADLPYSLFTEALDRHLAELGERRLRLLGISDPQALVTALPALADLAGETDPGDRHRTHRALRDLIERLAATRPLLLWMDDVHWADPASTAALAALIERPPAAGALLAIAAREGTLPAPVSLAFGGALRAERADHLELGPLSRREAEELVGAAADSLYSASGGNPFYLEQLARSPGTGPGTSAAPGQIPQAVAAALNAELGALTPDAATLLDAASVAGDPFELGLAMAIAELTEDTALPALDELLERALVRPDEAPRRFVFRHPIVRHAVYEAISAGRRLAAHGRAAQELERRGAGPVERARHVEHAAEPGDAQAVELLVAAAGELQSPAPAAAARFYAAALRLLPERPDERARRAQLQAQLSDSQSAAGEPEAAYRTLLDGLQTAERGERLRLTVAAANTEWWLGRYHDARRRLQVALSELPAEPSADRIRLRLALGLTALAELDFPEAWGQAIDAREDARKLDEPVFEFAALAAGVLARTAQAEGGAPFDDFEAALRRLSAEQLATRLIALWMRGRAMNLLGEFAAALADLERARAIAMDTGRERLLIHLTVESVTSLVELGRLSDAIAAADEGVERARLLAHNSLLVWAHSARSGARLAAGEVQAALEDAREAAQVGGVPGIEAAGQPGWCLGAALTAAGEAEPAIAALQEGLGGSDFSRIAPAQRPPAAADLVVAQLACGHVAAADATLSNVGDAGTGSARAVAELTRARVLLAHGDADAAAEAAAAAHADAASAPLLAARTQLAQGQALAAGGRRDEAIAALLAAEAALDGFGARRHRDEAVRELRRLGRRVVRGADRAKDGEGVPLTARELEIAMLVAAGRSNREVAEELVLSNRTIEAHLRNIFAKLGVRSRVELTRAVELLRDR